ncbi:MAG: hypothetical protein SFW35_11930 [Chitinophagales bacterium]|nr:hypothetical protein [Chitinophagales bacterium]
MKNVLLLAFTLTVLFVLNSCSDTKDPDEPNEQELITTLKITFVDSANTSIVRTFQYRDPDGDGGNPAVQFDTIKLAPSKTYVASIVLLDESKTPADSISNEVREEGTDHQFFFTISGVNVTTSYEDVDDNGNPLGLESRWKTNTVGNGTAQIVLKHQPGVKAAAPGDQSLGDTDIELNFPLVIE